MLKEFYASKHWNIIAWGGLLVLLSSLFAQVHMTVLVNSWYKGFWNILQDYKNHTQAEAWTSLIYFFKVAGTYVVLAVITDWFTQLYAFNWRKALTLSYIPKWKKCSVDIEGSSQRIQQDTERLARIMESLGLAVVRAFMVLAAFMPILYELSKGLILELNGWLIPIIGKMDGNLVWLAVITSGGGTVVSYFVGWYLPHLEFNNQKVEAAYRKELVYAEDDKFKWALPSKVCELFGAVQYNYQRLFLHYGYFGVWKHSYDQVMMIVPILAACPNIFSGAIAIGGLMQILDAFGRVHGSFSLLIHRWTTITELRSILQRLRGFEANINKQALTSVPSIEIKSDAGLFSILITRVRNLFRKKWNTPLEIKRNIAWLLIASRRNVSNYKAFRWIRNIKKKL